MKDSLESFYIFCTCCFTSFLTSFYLHYSTWVDQHAKKSMFYETSPLPPCMAQEVAMLYDTLWHLQGRSCRGQGRSCRGQGRSCRGQGRSCRQYRHTYIRHIYLGAQLSASQKKTYKLTLVRSPPPGPPPAVLRIWFHSSDPAPASLVGLCPRAPPVRPQY